MQLELRRPSKPVRLMPMLPVCLVGGLFAGGYLGGWLRHISVSRYLVGFDHSYGYEWGFYIIGGAIFGAVIAGVAAFAVALRPRGEEDP